MSGMMKRKTLARTMEEVAEVQGTGTSMGRLLIKAAEELRRRGDIIYRYRMLYGKLEDNDAAQANQED